MFEFNVDLWWCCLVAFAAPNEHIRRIRYVRCAFVKFEWVNGTRFHQPIQFKGYVNNIIKCDLWMLIEVLHGAKASNAKVRTWKINGFFVASDEDNEQIPRVNCSQGIRTLVCRCTKLRILCTIWIEFFELTTLCSNKPFLY